MAKWLDAVTEDQAKERPADRVEAMLLNGKRMAQFAGSFAVGQ